MTGKVTHGGWLQRGVGGDPDDPTLRIGRCSDVYATRTASERPAGLGNRARLPDGAVQLVRGVLNGNPGMAIDEL